MTRRMKGDVGFRKLIRQLPPAAKQEMGDVLEGAGPDFAQAMKADAPVKTGAYRAAITWKLLRASLRLRVGLIGKRANRDIFYARILEGGFPAGSKLVERRRVGVRASGHGLSRGRKRASDIASRYTLHWKGRPKHPVIFKSRPMLRSKLGSRLRTYWNDVLTRAGEGASFDD